MKWEVTESDEEKLQIEIAEIQNNSKNEITKDLLYTELPNDSNYIMLQKNLQNCLEIVDNEVMKKYVPLLQKCDILPLDESYIKELEQIQFFRITKLVYQENEFSVHKLATAFNTLSNKPCTLVLLIQNSDVNTDFYLGVRSRDSRYSTGTMRQLLEQSLYGLFPGSETANYYNEELQNDLNNLNINCISSVTSIADFKQDKKDVNNKDFIQGLEKFIYSMEGKPFTAICIANNLEYNELTQMRKEYEQIYTLLSPFANMQYNYAMNKSLSSSNTDTIGKSETESKGKAKSDSRTESESNAETQGTSISENQSNTIGNSISEGYGQNHTVGKTDGINESETNTNTSTKSKNKGINFGFKLGLSIGRNSSKGVSSSVSRGKTHGISHTDSISDSVSKNLTLGLNESKTIGNAISENNSETKTYSYSNGIQYSENESESLSVNFSQSKALTNTFGDSQAVTLNVQNKTLINLLDRLEKQMHRLDECESIGMWDFAAYFLGESAAEAESAASMYRSLVSGNQSGLEMATVNTWVEEDKVALLSKYVTNFLHPVFLYQYNEYSNVRQTLVDATALSSTNELAIQLGLPRKSLKGLPVISHADFGKEVLRDIPKYSSQDFSIGKIFNMGHVTNTKVKIDCNSLAMHTFITGSTGSGKSTAIYSILDKLMKTPIMNQENSNVKFLVVEPTKGEYKTIFGNNKDVFVYGTNPKKTPLLRINPFSFPDDIHVLEHIDRIIEIFNVCWPMYAAMPAVLKNAIELSYEDCGWDLATSINEYGDNYYPTFKDVCRNVKTIIDSSEYDSENKGAYKGSLLTRLQSLTNGINGMIFTKNEILDCDLFDENVVVDLSRVGSMETKSLIMGMLVIKLQEYRMAKATFGNAPLKHVTVLEEAHNLLKRTSTEQSAEGSNLLGKSVEMLANSIAEMRTYGEGFIIADQAPGLMDMSVIRNTNTKIILRLPDYSDRELVGKAATLNDDQIIELSRLETGVAAIYQNNWIEPVLCKIDKADLNETEYAHNFNQHIETQSSTDDKIFIATLLSKSNVISDEMVLKDVYDKVNKLAIDDFIKVQIVKWINNPPHEPRMTKLAPIMCELFPSIRKAVKESYKEANNPKEWTKKASLALDALTDYQLATKLKRDIVQCAITDYVYLELNNQKDMEKWCREGEISCI